MTGPPRPTTRRAKDPVPTRRSAAPRKAAAPKPGPEPARPARSSRKLLLALGGGLAVGAIALTGLIARRRIAAWAWRDGEGD